MDGIRVASAATLVRPVFAVPEKPQAGIRKQAGPGRPRLSDNSLRFDGIRRPVTPQSVLESMSAPSEEYAAATDQISASTEAVATLNRGLSLPKFPSLPAARMGLIAIPLAALLLVGVVRPLRFINHTTALSSRSAVASQESAQPTSLPATASTQATEPISDLATPPAIDSAKLQSLVDTWASAQPAQIGIIVKDLVSGTTISHNPDVPMTSASLYKLFVAAEVYHRIDTGTLNYGQIVAGSDGKNITQCLKVMINISDNTCGRALGLLVGWDQATARAKTLGFGATDLRRDPMQTTATDVSRLLERLYSGTLLSTDSTQQFMALLKDQRVNNRLPIGLPVGTVIAHKTGDLDGFVHDAGIVFGPKSTYLITVTSGPWSSPGSASSSIADISRNVYALLNQ